MDSLCIRDALELHRIVSPYLPVVSGDEDALKVVHHVIQNMKEQNPQAYLDSVLLMSGKSLEELMELDSNDILSLFIDGLTINRVVSLDAFCERLGVKYG